ncbi:MAG: sulfopyruvate decarboxylase [Chloroflexi bacterium]|nr:sulfopyruvate decarboxylase [Chloroflexota bacterium]
MPTTSSQKTYGPEAARLITEELTRCGVKLVVTLPDSWMGKLYDELDREPGFTRVRVFAEPEGIGICAGAYFGGMGSCLVMANAGFLLCTYHLPTLLLMHRIPLLMLISYRGRIGDTAFFQEYQGLLTEPLLNLMEIQFTVVDGLEDIPKIGEAYRHSRLSRRPAAVLLTRSVLV